MSEPLGATAAEWWCFDFELGLTAHLLPCVPYSPDVQCVEGSSLAGKVGKIPSVFNGAGLAHGLKDWPKRAITPAEVELWARDRRLNICLRLGEETSGVYALDIDIDDPQLAARIENTLRDNWPKDQPFPKRTRSNSGKFLIPFKLDESK